MYWQLETLRSGASWTVGGTYQLDLPDHGMLGSLLFHIYGGAVTDSMVAIDKWRLLDYISELKVLVNGTELIKDVTGQVAHYQQFLDGGAPITDKHFNYGSSNRRHHGVLHFGRRLYDPEMGLDLGRYKSVEIQFTNDAAAAQFASALSIDVHGLFLRDAPASQFGGYIKSEEWRKWVTVSDEHKYVDLPTRGRLRRLILQVIPDVDANYAAEATPYNVAYNILLTKRSGQDRIFDRSLRDLWYLNLFEQGRDIFQAIEPYHTQDYGIWTGFGQTLGMGGVRIPHDGIQDTATPSITPGDDSSTIRRMTDTDADQESMIVTGLALENCAHFRFDQWGSPGQWLDLDAEGTVSLDIHTRSGAAYADGTIRAVLDRFVAA